MTQDEHISVRLNHVQDTLERVIEAFNQNAVIIQRNLDKTNELVDAINTLNDKLGTAIRMLVEAKVSGAATESPPPAPDPILDKSLLELELSVRATNVLVRNRPAYGLPPINTVRELTEMSEHELMREPGFGRRSLKQVKKVLDFYGLHLRGSSPPKE